MNNSTYTPKSRSALSALLAAPLSTHPVNLPQHTSTVYTKLNSSMHRKGNEKYFHYVAAGFVVSLIGLGVLGQPHHDDARKLILFPNQIKDVNDRTVIRFLRFQLHLPLRRKTIYPCLHPLKIIKLIPPYGMCAKISGHPIDFVWLHE